MPYDDHAKSVWADTLEMIRCGYYPEAHMRLLKEVEKARDFRENNYLGYDDAKVEQYETLLQAFEDRHLKKAPK